MTILADAAILSSFDKARYGNLRTTDDARWRVYAHIPDAEFRATVVRARLNGISLGCEFKTPQGYTEDELQELDAFIVATFHLLEDLMSWLKDHDALKGEGMSCFTRHDLALGSADIRRIGFPTKCGLVVYGAPHEGN